MGIQLPSTTTSKLRSTLAYVALLGPVVMWNQVAAFGHHHHSLDNPSVQATSTSAPTPNGVSPSGIIPALAELKTATLLPSTPEVKTTDVIKSSADHRLITSTIVPVANPGLKGIIAQTRDPHVDFRLKSNAKTIVSHDEVQVAKALHADRRTHEKAPQRTSTVACILLVDGKRRVVYTSAVNVRELLAEQHVALRPNDHVTPALNSPLVNNSIARVQRVHAWIHHELVKIPTPTIKHHDANLFIGERRIVHKGHPGSRVRLIAIRTVDGWTSTRHVLKIRVLKHADPEIVAIGTKKPIVGPWPEFTPFALSHSALSARNAFNMMATAYTAYCDTCSGTGRGATGMVVTHGVVAVDPRVIALGSHLYIPGYGPAIAGDTGGAIIGNRIDLAMNTLADAVNFGRRMVTIYLLDSGHHHESK